MAVRALRGATTLDEDSSEQMHARVGALVRALFERNDVRSDDVISMFITTTPDLRATFAAGAVRACGLDDVALLGAQEADVIDGLPRCVRVLVHVETDRPRSALRHVYLEGARVLRPDLADG